MLKMRIIALLILFIAGGIGYFNYNSEIKPESKFPFKLGLDLVGGTHLVYKADISEIETKDIASSMDALRDVIERRTNLFGVSEPMVQIEKSSVFASGEQEHRLIVELPGITDISEAIKIIGETPVLEFRLVNKDNELFGVIENEKIAREKFDAMFVSTGLTGKYLKKSTLEFGQGGIGGYLQNGPIVRLDFTKEGGELFAKITRENVGRMLAIFLDGNLKSTPIINEEITGGSAIVSGDFTPEEAKTLVRNLNLGALPLPIELINTQTIGASLGKDALHKGIQAGMIGFIVIAVFMLVWYRLPGFVAVVSLTIYIIIMLALFKLIPVTLTSAGLAGFLLSMGMAVDANVLIFERMREEFKNSNNTENTIHNGFKRAWLSIRDGNISSIITAIILFWFGTSLVKGFALTFGIGVFVSMLSAIMISRIFLYAFNIKENRGIVRFLFGSGIR